MLRCALRPGILAVWLACGAAFAHAPCIFSISPATASVGAGLSPGVITITGSPGCSRTVASNSPWITITYGQTGTGSGTAGWSAAPNNTPSPRTGTITAAGQTFTITQAGAACEYTLLPGSAAFGPAGDKGAFTVKSGCLWTPEPIASWIAIDNVTANGEVHFSVAPNPLTATRTGGIRAGGSTFAITQTGPCLAIPAPPAAPLASGGGSYSFTVSGSAGCGWTASSAVPWISISAGNGSGSGTVTYTAAANSGAARSGAIRVNDQTYAVTQAGAACEYTLAPAGASVPAAGGSGSVHVTTDARCSWTATSNASWIRTSGPSVPRTGPGEAQYVVDANAATAPRTGTLTIGNRTFTVSQNGAEARLRLDVVASAASYVQTGVAPGEIVYLEGSGLGPAALATLHLTADGGGITDAIAGARVFFDGRPAPMVYASDGAVSAIVPYAVAGQTATRVEVEYQGNRSNAMTVPVLPAKPGIFSLNASGAGQAAALNQDLSVNGAANPAARGEVVVLYVTGAGETNPPSTDGRLSIGEYPAPRLPISVLIGGVEAVVHYAGAAPGLVSGVIQVNAVIPAEIAPGDAGVVLRAGGRASQPGITIAVK